LEAGHARALLPLPPSQQKEVAVRVITTNLSVRQTENLARSMLANKTDKIPSAKDPDTRRLQEELSSRLSAQVDIQHHKNGSGKLTIYYGSLNSLDRLLEKLRQ
jgi:ParB family chromosome partitioning protein